MEKQGQPLDIHYSNGRVEKVRLWAGEEIRAALLDWLYPGGYTAGAPTVTHIIVGWAGRSYKISPRGGDYTRELVTGV